MACFANILIFCFFRFRVKAVMTVESMEALLQKVLLLHALVIIETIIPEAVIPCLMQDLEKFEVKTAVNASLVNFNIFSLTPSTQYYFPHAIAEKPHHPK